MKKINLKENRGMSFIKLIIIIIIVILLLVFFWKILLAPTIRSIQEMSIRS